MYIAILIYDYLHIIIRDVYDVIYILAYLLFATAAALYAYYLFDKDDFNKHVHQPIQWKIHSTYTYLAMAKFIFSCVYAFKQYCSRKISIYLASSRRPYFIKIIRTYIERKRQAIKLLPDQIKRYFNKKK